MELECKGYIKRENKVASFFKKYWVNVITVVLCVACCFVSITQTKEIQGEQGIQGLQGIQGEKGEQGERGADGVNGKDGIDGKDGKDGVDGINGKDGINGINGLNGKDGKDGINGVNGLDGRDGKDGVDGADGRGIQKIYLLSSENNIDTYRILYSDCTYFDFVVTNGRDGILYENGETEILSQEWVTVYGEKYNAIRYISKNIIEYRYSYKFRVEGSGSTNVGSNLYAKIDCYIQVNTLYGQINNFEKKTYIPEAFSGYFICNRTNGASHIYPTSFNGSQLLDFEPFVVETVYAEEALQEVKEVLGEQIIARIVSEIESNPNNTAKYEIELVIE